MNKLILILACILLIDSSIETHAYEYKRIMVECHGESLGLCNLKYEDGQMIYMIAIVDADEEKSEDSGKDGLDLKSEENIEPVIEEPAEFPGGITALTQFLASNIIYPSYCQEKNIEGKVIVNFKIDKDGKIQDPVIVCSAYPELDMEAVRVVKSMPAWNPGKVNGELTDTFFNLPVKFSLAFPDEIRVSEKIYNEILQAAHQMVDQGDLDKGLRYYCEAFTANPNVIYPIVSMITANDGKTEFGSDVDIVANAYAFILSRINSPFNMAWETYEGPLWWIDNNANLIAMGLRDELKKLEVVK